MGLRYLFLSPAAGAFGELTLGLALARQLDARGHRVSFLAPSSQASLLAGTPFAHGLLDDVGPLLPQVLPAIVRKRRFDRVVLVDLTATLVTLALARLDAAFLDDLGAPVAAIDIWSLDETDHVWDAGPDRLPLPRADGVRRRLRPVPFVRPEAPGAFCAWPEGARGARRDPTDPGPRQILFTTARWQARPAQPRPHDLRLLATVPEILFAALARLGNATRVVHVGPHALDAGRILGDRYRFKGWVSPAELDRLLDGSRLLLTLNQASSVLGRALARGVPAAAVVCAHAGATVEEVVARLPSSPSPRLREALAGLVPLHPFRVWPLGLHAFLSGPLAKNPVTEAIPALELLHEEALVATCDALLEETPRRRAHLERVAAYRARVAALPRAADRLEEARPP